MTALAVILPSKTLHLFGHDIHSQYLIILVAMVLWGVAEGYGYASMNNYNLLISTLKS